jgi:adenylyl-sulfate kinase
MVMVSGISNVSIEGGEVSRALFIGRFSPFHNGHYALVAKALDAGKPVAIGVRDTPISEHDPLPTKDRIEMIRECYRGKDVVVFAMPDIASVNIGRDVGYEIVKHDLPESVKVISGTEIRRLREAGDRTWRDAVPEGVANWFDGRDDHHVVVWLTGPPASGKSTLLRALKERYPDLVVLDADTIRPQYWPELTHTPEDRMENVLRLARMARAFVDSGHTVLVAAVSPMKDMRDAARAVVGAEAFRLVHVYAPMDVLRSRDPKGLYAKADAGEITNLTGVGAPYEMPEDADCMVDTGLNDEMPLLCAAGIARVLSLGGRKT